MPKMRLKMTLLEAHVAQLDLMLNLELEGKIVI